MSFAAALVLRDGDRDRLSELARRPSVPAGLARRARMVLLAADGVPNAEIARRVGVSRPTVIGWRERYQAGGIDALEDAPRSGRPARIDEIEVVVATLAADGVPRGRPGAARWSARALAAELGISFASVARIWRKWGIQPHRIGAFEFPTEPPLPAGVRDVVGLQPDPPATVVVVSAGRTGQRGRLGRSAAGQAAADAGAADAGAADGGVKELLRFLQDVAVACPGQELHGVLDRGTACQHPEVIQWLAANPLVRLHAVAAGHSWVQLAEIFLAIAAGRSGLPGSAGAAPLLASRTSEPARRRGTAGCLPC